MSESLACQFASVEIVILVLDEPSNVIGYLWYAVYSFMKLVDLFDVLDG